MKPTVRAYDAKLDVELGSRTIVSTINTASVDRYKTVILPGGGRLESYRLNPVVLAMHDGAKVPIGRNLWIKPDRPGDRATRLIAKTQFLPEGVDELADKIFRLYQEGFLSAWSIGMNPIEWGKPTAEELRKHPEWAGADIIFRAWELLEYSGVTTPGNAECLTEAVSRGLALPGWEATATAPAAKLPPLAGRTYDQVKADTLKRVRSQVLATTAGATAGLSRDAMELARGMV